MQAEGLKKPSEVIAALNQWRKASDNVFVFVHTSCTPDPRSSVGAQALYDRYQEWCVQHLKTPVLPKVFGECIGRRYRKRRKASGLFYEGLKTM